MTFSGNNTPRRVYTSHNKDPEAIKFYQRKPWRMKREEILFRDNHMCQRCLASDILRAATMVHHILSYKEHPELALVDSNLISLCNGCHNAVHPEKGEKNRKKPIQEVDDAVIKVTFNEELF